MVQSYVPYKLLEIQRPSLLAAFLSNASIFFEAGGHLIFQVRDVVHEQMTLVLQSRPHRNVAKETTYCNHRLAVHIGHMGSKAELTFEIDLTLGARELAYATIIP